VRDGDKEKSGCDVRAAADVRARLKETDMARLTILGKAIRQTEQDIARLRAQSDGEIAVLDKVLAQLKQQQAATERRRTPAVDTSVPHKAES
jgi:hypothetical protein